MRTYGSAEKRYSKQLVNAYIVYMMLGSFFGWCRFKNTMEESRLKMHYVAMSSSEQVKREEEIEKVILEVIRPERIGDLKCEVRTSASKGRYFLLFHTGIMDFIVEVLPKGRIIIRQRAAA